MKEKEKYTYLVGPWEYCPNEKHFDYEEVITEVNELVNEIHKKTSTLDDKEEIEDLIFSYNPIKIYKDMVEYDNDEPIGGMITDCIKIIELK